jgi:hypothetical protein
MAEFKGTKGPWEIGKYNSCVISKNDESLSIRGSVGEDAIEYYGGNLICESVSKSNAKLIAAAPELLEALIEVVKISDRNHIAWDKAKSAIKKATEL